MILVSILFIYSQNLSQNWLILSFFISERTFVQLFLIAVPEPQLRPQQQLAALKVLTDEVFSKENENESSNSHQKLEELTSALLGFISDIHRAWSGLT